MMLEALFMVPSTDIPKYEVPAVYREYEKCVAKRESNGRPEAVSPSGKYRGMFQFDEELKDGTTWHIVDWLATWHPQPRKYAAVLRDTPMNKWPKQVQRAAFVAVLDGHDKGKRWAGKAHFDFGNRSC
jgi:hypothetical protein